MKIQHVVLSMLGAVAIAAPISAATPEFPASGRDASAQVTEHGAASYIVQAKTLRAALAAANRARGQVTHELGIINAVAAILTRSQAATNGVCVSRSQEM